MLQPPPEPAGTTIAPYKLLEQIGEGGMGIVFMVEQVQPVRRKVKAVDASPARDAAFRQIGHPGSPSVYL
jgi:hypothetical protein